MGNSISDALLLVRRHLLNKSDVTDIVEERVYSHHFYDFDNQTVEMPMIVIEHTAGTSNYGMKKQKINVKIYCYSKNASSESLSLYDKVYNNLHAEQLLVSGVSVRGYIYEESRPNTGYNPQARAWFSVGNFSLNLAG